MMYRSQSARFSALLSASVFCLVSWNASAQNASDYTKSANARFSETLPWSDDEDFALADRGFIATREDPVIKDENGKIVMDLSAYDFAVGDAPDTVNPSLWRHLKLIRKHGLYEVTDGVWQVRGFDLSTMSILATETGYVIIDPLLTKETAAAALELVYEELGEKPIRAVIYTHSHGDHFGGVKGVTNEADVKAGNVQILAPYGFMEHAVSENLTVGPAMTRRAVYQFGTSLPRGPEGQAGNGIGTTLSSGTMTLIAPTREIKKTGETIIIDGLTLEFQVTPGSEAPAEMNIYLSDQKALCLAENANATMHNVLTPRGALVRDSRAWAGYLTESIGLFGNRSDVVFTSHGWPRWGQENIHEYVSHHRDAYKYLHDQSVRLMNQGLTETEIAEHITLPEALAAKWYNRGYYGTMSHNSKAVYQRYLGWYDGNPVNLNAWPPEEAGKRYVKAMGGESVALEIAQNAYNEGDYRWSSEVASRIIFANDLNTDARQLLSKSFRQMAWQAEGMLWRNMYLTGASEVKAPVEEAGASSVSRDLISAVEPAALLELLAVRVNPEKAVGKDLVVRFSFTDLKESYLVTLRNSVLIQERGGEGEAQAELKMPKQAFLALLFSGASPQSLLEKGMLAIEGNPSSLQALMSALDTPSDAKPFEIVAP